MTRQVPAHEVYELAARTTRYAVLVCVINEGQRILDQLTRMQAIDGMPDIVICDGGSQDGSMAIDGLRARNVRALLVRSGPGRLGAQQRIGFAWLLDQGYEGIITLDGNGKDGVEAIPDFVAALDDGYDFVQGSRYVDGGVAENTPMSRHIAVRYIHAPIVSSVAGRRFTDTTNAFRAHSRRYLGHPKVQPFRDVFVGYELLAYLSVRAAQLGLLTTELPVRRSYPTGGAVPTKISGLRGNLELLGVLWQLVRGELHPDD